MSKKNSLFTEDVKFTTLFALGLLLVFLVMAVASFLLRDKPAADIEDNQKTVIIMQAKQEATHQKKAQQSVVSSVRDAITKDKNVTPYVQINKMDKESPENKELKNMVEHETKKRKAGGVRKEATDSGKILRYIDESTPRDRSSDAAYVYFVDVSGILIPRFCVQIALKQHLNMNAFSLSAASKTVNFIVPSYQSSNINNGVAEWYDVPLNKEIYGVVQAIIKAKKAVLSIYGLKGNVSRNLSDDEIKAFQRILDGYTALGGSLNYLQVDKLPAKNKK